jgi:hypothetical protein
LENDHKPLLATGKLGGNYRLLYSYWKFAGGSGSEKAEAILLNKGDFEKALSIIERENRIPLGKLVEHFKKIFLPRIDSELAVRAYKEVYGIEAPSDVAVEEVAKTIALWLLEALELEGKISFK